MEPDIMPLHASSPPPLGGVEEAGSEEDEFGDFGGFSVVVSCSHPVYADWTDAARPPPRGFDPSVEQSQPASAYGDSGSGLANGFPEGDPASGRRAEETGFADFTVFAEQAAAAHPWCCGFSPAGGKERWDVRAERSGREVVLDSEPGHRERRRGGAARTQPTQDRRPALEAAAAAALDQPPEDRREERRSGFKGLKEMQRDGESEHSAPALPQTVGAYESASEDPASFSDDLSLECPSADLEPNVSSLVSQEDQTDWDQTDDDNDEDELDRCRHCDGGFHDCDRSATQETCAATSDRSTPAATHTETETEDTARPAFRDCGGAESHGVRGRGNLPPSDSFADFCSAPTRDDGDGDGSWAEFKDRRAVEEEEEEEEEEGEREKEARTQTDGVIEEEPEWAGPHGGSRRKSSFQGSLSCRVQQLLLACFPEVEDPAAVGEEEDEEEEEEEEVQSLGTLLHARRLPDSEEEEEEDGEEEEEEEEEEGEMPELGLGSKWIHQDLHDAVGLRFQWGGSHANRTLLRCLGVETRNIVFIGIKKQPVAVPAFASSLGMLEPTKDSPSVCTAASTDTTQEALPPSPPAWSSRGLVHSQDGTSPRRAPPFWGWK